ncbi:mechanosensitive ion channel domain-containing protein [Bergeyella zoohelcum]|uniref:mechanosensitive ion channel family protein n=1 Tax=Bergeyella zoohelcum TaxID=1015 RepID=UPI002A90C9CE|nr:mechanosensitive ion channel domain-containing protein [Bergeyella zoohelcum]MDY6025678.1 mechanosensitive ion channel [Bergeyella zoohelcum]
MEEIQKLNISNLDINLLIDKAISYGIKIAAGLLIVVIGFWLAARVSKFIKKKLNIQSLSLSLQKFIGDIIGMLIRILVILAAMNTMGVETTSFVALLGGLAVGVGMALQGSLSNFAGGLLILVFKPFRVGDVVEVMGNTGTVEEISILQTIILKADLKTVILPNGNVFNNAIINYSKTGVRRVEITIGIGYQDDFDKAKEVLIEVMKNEPLLLHDKGYVLEINDFGDNSVNLAMYAFTESSNFLQAKWRLNRATKLALDKHGISIPYPQREVHVIK